MGSPSFNPCESTLVGVVSTDHARGSAPLAIATIGCPNGEIPAAAGSLSCAYLQFMAWGVYLRSGPCQRRHADSIAHRVKNAWGVCTHRKSARRSIPTTSRCMTPLARCDFTCRMAPSGLSGKTWPVRLARFHLVRQRAEGRPDAPIRSEFRPAVRLALLSSWRD